MDGIDLNQPIIYKHSSLRFIKEGEHHITRFCKDDVLLLVYDGVLRFSEGGREYEIHPGEYFIQRRDRHQAGILPSDAPKYLYVHFRAHWEEGQGTLSRRGLFDYAKFKTVMEEMDTLAHSNAPYITKSGKFYELLSSLYQTKPENSVAIKIADYIAKECYQSITLDMLCEEFHFSKNHIINVFKKEFGMTPITYMNHLRLQRAKYLMEVTSDSLEKISEQCGFHNYSYFYKLFFREHGLSPEKWRDLKRIG